MQKFTMAAALALITAASGFSQKPDASIAFEVASIKPAEPPTAGMMRIGMRGGPGTPEPGQLNYTNVSLNQVLTKAYGVKNYEISGPKWLDSERFDIVAKIPHGTTKEQFQIMLQNLLIERFKLAAHQEKKELPMFALVVGKNGPKLKESVEDPPAGANASKDGADGAAPPPPPPPDGPMKFNMGKDGFPQMPPGAARKGTMMMMMNGRFRMMANKQTMSGLSEMLGNQLDRPVVDMTDLKGTYDFTLDFAPEEGSRGFMGGMMPPPPPGGGAGGGGGVTVAGGGGGSMEAHTPDSQTPAPSLFTAIQEQLGLKLEPRKGPVDLVVIDHMEKEPIEN